MLHIQVTPAFHLENIFQIEAMAYKPILQAALEKSRAASCRGPTVSKYNYILHPYLYLFLYFINMQ